MSAVRFDTRSKHRGGAMETQPCERVTDRDGKRSRERRRERVSERVRERRKALIAGDDGAMALFLSYCLLGTVHV